jgi:GDP-L-fucose synthase
MREVDLLSGPLEPTNRPYALAKIAGIEMCWAYNRQYGTRYFAVMPTNCYGPGDNYDLENSHVLPALIRKVHEAKEVGQESFTAWGTGEVFREFLYSDDLADACVHIMNLPREKLNFLFSNEYPPLINIGSGAELRIREITALVAQVIGFKGIIRWDKTKPDGAPKKLLDSSRINGLGWYPKTALEDGIKLAYKDFLQRFNKSP